nr:ribonuclease H-like domain-containing protein [Tanacetum cinerariifolium]
MKITLEKTIEDGLGPCYKKLATLEEGVSKMMRMLMEEKKDDMGAYIEKLDKVGYAAQDPMYNTALLLFVQSADYRKLWLHLKPESCGNWVKRFLAQSIRSSNVIALGSPYLLVLIIEKSQSRQHDKQLDGLPIHKEKYDVSFHTKKVFANIKRIGKGFSVKETSLFLTMIKGLESRVKKLEKKQMSRTHKLKRLYKVGLTAWVISSIDDEALDKEDTSKQGRIDEIDADEDISLEEVVKVVTTAKMIIDAIVDVAQVTTSINDITVSDAKTIVTTAPTITAESRKINVEVTQAPKRRGVMIQEPEETITTIKTTSSQQPQLQLIDAKKAKLFMEFIEKRRKFFAAKRTEEKRNKPPTKAQQRNIMCNYLKKRGTNLLSSASSENRPPMLNKENYVSWSSRLLRYAKSRPNGKLIHISIINGQYVRRMIPEPGDPNREVPMNETFHQMMKGSDIRIQEKKAKLFNGWERFTSTDGESIESYYHRFLNLKRNKHFPEKITSNLKFLNNMQPEWSRHVTIVHQTKDLHTIDYTQLYDFLKYNQKEVDDLKAERLAKTQDPLALMATSNNPYTFPVLPQDQQSFNQNYMQQPMPNPKDIIDCTTTINMADCSTGYEHGSRQIDAVGWRNQVIQNDVKNPRIQNVGNQNGLIVVPGNANQNPNGNVRQRRRDAAYLQTQLLIAQKEEAGIQLQAEEFDLMAAAADLDEIEEVNANCILMASLQQASTSGTQTDKAPIYDSDGSAEVQNYEDCYENEIFNMFTQEEQYTELLEPIPEPHQVPQNHNNVIYEVFSVEQSGETVEQHPTNVEETRVLYDSLYNNLAIEVEKVNTVNCKLSETNAELTTELARYKNQEKCFKISQEKYDKLKRCY